MARLEFFFDFGSPYTYYAAHRFRNDPAYAAVEIEWTPFLLGGLFKAVGNKPPIEVPPKGVYMLRDLQRLSEYYKIPFQFPPDFPIVTLMPMRGATALKLQQSPRYLDYCMAMFDAFWARGKNIADPAAWAEVTASAGLDPKALQAAIETPEVKDELKKQTVRAAELGAFGAPTFVVDGELYWGFDRLFLVERALGLVRS